MVFLHYDRGRESWTTKERLEARRAKARDWIADARRGGAFASSERAKDRTRAATTGRREQRRNYMRQRYATAPLFAMSCRIRVRTREAVRRIGVKMPTATTEALGASWEAVAAWIQRQFADGMSWDNIGEWHIDHVVPLASAKNEHELRQLFHYTNLRPAWPGDNLSKRDGTECLSCPWPRVGDERASGRAPCIFHCSRKLVGAAGFEPATR